jgi:hypothetical protein
VPPGAILWRIVAKPDTDEIQKLISIIEEIAGGKYPGAVMELTKPPYCLSASPNALMP